jgi:hypothetical protein
MLMKEVIAKEDGRHHFGLLTELGLETAGHSSGSLQNPHRRISLLFPADAGEELIDYVNNG